MRSPSRTLLVTAAAALAVVDFGYPNGYSAPTTLSPWQC